MREAVLYTTGRGARALKQQGGCQIADHLEKRTGGRPPRQLRGGRALRKGVSGAGLRPAASRLAGSRARGSHTPQ
jgi:hypothetical protein